MLCHEQELHGRLLPTCRVGMFLTQNYRGPLWALNCFCRKGLCAGCYNVDGHVTLECWIGVIDGSHMGRSRTWKAEHCARECEKPVKPKRCTTSWYVHAVGMKVAFGLTCWAESLQLPCWHLNFRGPTRHAFRSRIARAPTAKADKQVQ